MRQNFSIGYIFYDDKRLINKYPMNKKYYMILSLDHNTDNGYFWKCAEFVAYRSCGAGFYGADEKNISEKDLLKMKYIGSIIDLIKISEIDDINNKQNLDNSLEHKRKLII